MRVLLFGAQGWIASHILPLFHSKGWTVISTSVRADDTEEVRRLLDTEKPDRVVSLIGRTHGPGYNSIDYLEQPGKLRENVRDNLYAPLSLGMLCSERNIHYTYLGTGCIFSDEDPTMRMYSEKDDPNFFGSSYSTVKGFTDRLMKLLEGNTLNVRIRMPITPDLHPRNFITKIVGYEKICSMPNSMSVLPTLLPLLVDMIEKGKTGTVNLVNPGLMTHNDVLEMYRDTVDHSKTWTNFDIVEQDHILQSKRSNNQLDTKHLQSMYPHVPPIHIAVQACMDAIAANK